MSAQIEWGFFAAVAAAYVAGSIPVGFLLGKAQGIDLRKEGSGNIGATNAMRVLGRKTGLLCFALDVAKGFLPTLVGGLALGLVERAGGDPAAGWRWMAIAGTAVLGHMFPIWLGFRGGKGVATGLGALLALWPVMTLAAAGALLLWLTTLKLTRYVGVSSCVAAASLPLLAALVWGALAQFDAAGGWPWSAAKPFLVVSTGLALLVLWRHRGNIARTLAGTEPRVGTR
ncbi:MAG: glycerol-3-phosphate 1-O-acyltransferase [Planctomycetota bacterium]|nr:MAG: glycerol-3-phosphate 1-O-acyltransferase [Planctomycetota bacterium]